MTAKVKQGPRPWIPTPLELHDLVRRLPHCARSGLSRYRIERTAKVQFFQADGPDLTPEPTTEFEIQVIDFVASPYLEETGQVSYHWIYEGPVDLGVGRDR